MRKVLLTVIVLFATALTGVTTASAGNFGVVGGASFLGIRDVSAGVTTSYHAGLTYKFKLPAGFAIQPSLLYHMKNSAYDSGASEVDLKVGYVELPVSFQWGPDLLLFRPFLDVSPFVGYGVHQDFDMLGFDDPGKVVMTDAWKHVNRLEYGLGIGGGIEIWKLQLVCRYNWNFGSLLNQDNKVDVSDILRQELNDKNFGGVTLSLALLF